MSANLIKKYVHIDKETPSQFFWQQKGDFLASSDWQNIKHFIPGLHANLLLLSNLLLDELNGSMVNWLHVLAI